LNRRPAKNFVTAVNIITAITLIIVEIVAGKHFLTKNIAITTTAKDMTREKL
jgi:hypothetical protein